MRGTLIIGGVHLKQETKTLYDTYICRRGIYAHVQVYIERKYLQQRAFCRRLSFMAVRQAENRTLFKSAEERETRMKMKQIYKRMDINICYFYYKQCITLVLTKQHPQNCFISVEWIVIKQCRELGGDAASTDGDRKCIESENLTQRLVELSHLGMIPACCLGLVAGEGQKDTEW